MTKKRLGVNIDHVATVRNARGESYPNPLRAALIAESSGADSITIHLREDRRHIRDKDLIDIKKKLSIPLNLEIAPTKEMLKIAIKNKPKFVCIVPEKRLEITTEGGLNLNRNKSFLKKMINKLKKNNIRVSLFIEPAKKDLKTALILNTDCVELHTGNFCNAYNKNKKTAFRAYNKLKACADLGKRYGLEVHAGHGLTFKSAKVIKKINSITEFNIGHFLIAESLFISMNSCIKKFKKIINS
tara:strand:+ start:336 stop:1064 length:729 start_codon:yes stop_codon:yes gene_type:complete